MHCTCIELLWSKARMKKKYSGWLKCYGLVDVNGSAFKMGWNNGRKLMMEILVNGIDFYGQKLQGLMKFDNFM